MFFTVVGSFPAMSHALCVHIGGCYRIAMKILILHKRNVMSSNVELLAK